MQGSGSVTGECALALLVPILPHTLYDAGTATNAYPNSDNEDAETTGVIIALVFTAVLFIMQIVVLARTKRNAGKYCEMAVRDSDKESGSNTGTTLRTE